MQSIPISPVGRGALVRRRPDPAFRQAGSADFTVFVPRAQAVPDVYRRRRLAVFGVVVFALALLLGAGQVLANRGGDPASIPTVRPATAYVVQAGDTMWSLSERFHGSSARAAYLERLLADNGGPRLQVGQLLNLP